MPEDSGPADRCRRGWCSRDRWWHTRSTDPPTDPARRASLRRAQGTCGKLQGSWLSGLDLQISCIPGHLPHKKSSSRLCD
eukprot:6603238-Prymnesium_polylepis.1